jgi:hypothetical protein
MTQGMITGKEDILEYCRHKFKAHSWNTIRRWRKELSFPVHYLPSNTPFIMDFEVVKWAIKYDEITKEQKSAPL